MKGFKLDENGDIVIENGKIVMVDGNELLSQTVTTTLSTNKKEWFLNEDEGIDFDNILTKKPDFDLIRAEIEDGLSQVDSSLTLETFNYDFDKERRKLVLNFTARNKDGVIISGTRAY